MVLGHVAYIDPGTGGLIVSSIVPYIIAALAAVAAVFLKFLRPIKRVWQKFRKPRQ